MNYTERITELEAKLAISDREILRVQNEAKVVRAAMPRDDKGKFVPLDCPRLNCGGGILRHEGDALFSYWQCDSLAAPENDDHELYPCDFVHIDGQPYEACHAHEKVTRGKRK